MANALNLDVSKRVDITVRRGDTMKLTLEVKDSDNVAVDLTTYNDFKFEVRTDDLEDTAYADGDDGIVLSTEDDSSGDKHISYSIDSSNITFTCSAANMRGVESGLYVYDLEATNSSSEVQTWLYGIFKVNEDITV